MSARGFYKADLFHKRSIKYCSEENHIIALDVIELISKSNAGQMVLERKILNRDILYSLPKEPTSKQEKDYYEKCQVYKVENLEDINSVFSLNDVENK